MKMSSHYFSIVLILMFSFFCRCYSQSGQWDGFDAGTRNSWYSVDGATLVVDDYESTGIAGNGLFVEQGDSFRWVMSRLFNSMELGEVGTPMETIQLSFDFRIFDSNTSSNATSPGFPLTSNSLRFGLYHDNGTMPAGDNATASDDDIGYRGFIPFSASGSSNPGISRETGTHSEILTGNDFINLSINGSSTSKVYDKSVFSASMKITRITNGVEITVSIYDGPGLTGNLIARSVASETGSGIITTFNTIVFGSSENINFRLDNVKVTSGRSRFLLSEAKMQEIRSRVASGDTVLENAITKLITEADAYLNPNLSDIAHNASSKSANLGQARAALGRIHTLAFAYLYTDDSGYRDAAIDVMDTVCAFPDWYPSQFLNVAEMSLAVSIGYNWLYEELGASESNIRDALTDHVLSYVPVVYNPNGGTPGVWYAFSQNSDLSTNNWNPVCNAGILAAALTLSGEDPGTAQETIEAIQESLPWNLAYYNPSGVWPEGPTYYSYGGTFTAFILDAFRDTMATDFGLGMAAGFELAPAFFTHSFGPSGRMFNFGDAGNGKIDVAGASGAFLWATQEYGNEAERVTTYNWYGLYVDPNRSLTSSEITGSPGVASRTDVLKLLWCARQPIGGAATLPTDIVLDDGLTELAFIRDRADEPNALWVGIKAGTNGFSHSHLDGGSFVLESDGVRWAMDLGAEDYSLSGYWDDAPGGQRWDYYRTNNLSHNTLTIDEANQQEDARAEIIASGSTNTWGYVIIDLSDLYPAVESVVRGIAMIDRDATNHTEAILIQDEISGLNEEGIHWGMVTAAEITLDGTSTVATLVENGKEMEARILSPVGATFYEASTAPPTSEEKQNSNTTKLAIDYSPQTGENFVQICIVFEPIGSGWQPTTVPAVASLASWPL